MADRRHFETGGDAYARFRPTYPPRLAASIADLAPDRHRAVDVGCGSGQFSVLLARHFGQVDAVDVSGDQVAHATPHPAIRYSLAPAESLPLKDRSVSVVTAAQAAHWFDLPAFNREVRRVAKPGAIVALITYLNGIVTGPLAERFLEFYAHDVGEFWPPERRLIENEYRDLEFPFDELNAPVFEIVRDWSLPQLLGYVLTWSATKRAVAAGESGRVDVFIEDAHRLWGDANTVRRVTWPVRMRLGRV